MNVKQLALVASTKYPLHKITKSYIGAEVGAQTSIICSRSILTLADYDDILKDIQSKSVPAPWDSAPQPTWTPPFHPWNSNPY